MKCFNIQLHSIKIGQIWVKFRKNVPITADNAVEFFLDKTLLKRTNQSLNFIEKN